MTANCQKDIFVLQMMENFSMKVYIKKGFLKAPCVQIQKTNRVRKHTKPLRSISDCAQEQHLQTANLEVDTPDQLAAV